MGHPLVGGTWPSVVRLVADRRGHVTKRTQHVAAGPQQSAAPFRCASMAAMPTHIRHGRSSCPTACSLDVLGDKWTLLIIREALGGTTRFGDYWRRIPGLA